ncbi:hypothetical protein JZ751_028836 [Albula glossodonta]|uniref:Uncharacterized protein n=1 Tax=Albula glossodonta TaxID=121402 RepID=A0A8T2NAR2_9TELE|nr:hypothetical protein JZ751_028836 [Albula glossodonta]
MSPPFSGPSGLASLSPPADSVVVLEEGGVRGPRGAESPSVSPESEEFEAMPSEPIYISTGPQRPYSRSSSSSSQEEEKSTLEEVSEGAIPIDPPPSTALPTPGCSSQDPDLPFQHTQTLNKSSSSPELQTLQEAFAEAPGPAEGPAGTVRAGEGKAAAEGESVSVGGALNGQTEPPPVAGGGTASVSAAAAAAASVSRMRLEFPAPQPSPLSPSGHRPRGHTISVSAPSRRERKMERDTYHNRGAASNSEKTSGLSPSMVDPLLCFADTVAQVLLPTHTL